MMRRMKKIKITLYIYADTRFPRGLISNAVVFGCEYYFSQQMQIFFFFFLSTSIKCSDLSVFFFYFNASHPSASYTLYYNNISFYKEYYKITELILRRVQLSFRTPAAILLVFLFFFYYKYSGQCMIKLYLFEFFIRYNLCTLWLSSNNQVVYFFFCDQRRVENNRNIQSHSQSVLPNDN